MEYLKNLVKVTEYKALQPDYPSGTLVITDSQAVIDECQRRGQPVAGFEDGDSRLNCEYLFTDIDEVEDEEFEDAYRRCMGIPLDIATTDRTFIREFGMEDLDALYGLYNNPGITQFMEPLFEYEEERKYEENYIQYIYKIYGFGMWLIFDKTTGKLIGRAGIENRETCDREGQAEMGFCITPDRWGQGLAFEVCSKIIELARERYGLTSLIARSDPKNIASRKLLEKLGFELAGVESDGDCRYFRETM